MAGFLLWYTITCVGGVLGIALLFLIAQRELDIADCVSNEAAELHTSRCALIRFFTTGCLFFSY